MLNPEAGVLDWERSWDERKKESTAGIGTPDPNPKR